VTAAVGAGLLLALGSAVALNWGFFAQQQAAAALPPLSLGRPVASLHALAGARAWLAGFVLGLAGWALYIAALRLAPLSLVQAASAGGIGVLAILVARVSGQAVPARDRAGVAAALAGLALLALSLAGGSASSARGSSAALAAWVAVSLGIAAVAAAPPGRRLVPGAGLGVAAGVLYAAGDVATKGALFAGARLVFVPAILFCHGLAFAALQLAFQRGGALVTAGVATMWMNALPILAGSVVFADAFPAGLPGAARVGAFALVVGGSVLLAAGRHAPSDAALTGAVPADGGMAAAS
jgi:hypothetical protein